MHSCGTLYYNISYHVLLIVLYYNNIGCLPLRDVCSLSVCLGGGWMDDMMNDDTIHTPIYQPTSCLCL